MVLKRAVQANMPGLRSSPETRRRRYIGRNGDAHRRVFFRSVHKLYNIRGLRVLPDISKLLLMS